jgi:hypothetical protein
MNPRTEPTAIESTLAERVQELEEEKRGLLWACQEALEFAQQYEDVRDGSDGTPQPNAAMSLCSTLRDLLAKHPTPQSQPTENA